MKLLALLALSALSACSALQDKAVAINGNCHAIKVETTGGTASGTMMPNVIIGGGTTSFADAPLKEVADGKHLESQPVFSYSMIESWIGAVFGIQSRDVSMSYIGSPGETAEETEKRLKALMSIANPQKAEGSDTP